MRSDITQIFAIVSRHAPAGQTAPNYKGEIGITAEKTEGMDITGGAGVPARENG